MWNKDLQNSVMNFRSLIRFNWNHCIAITCIFKLGGVCMSISRLMKWNVTTSTLNIIASNYRSEFHFCLRGRSEIHPPLSVLLIFGTVSFRAVRGNKFSLPKQPFGGVLRKRYFEIMEQIYRSAISIKLVSLSRSYLFKFFKDCLPQILLGPFLNTCFKCYLYNSNCYILFMAFSNRIIFTAKSFTF